MLANIPSTATATTPSPPPTPLIDGEDSDDFSDSLISLTDEEDNDVPGHDLTALANTRRGYRRTGGKRLKKERDRLENHHPEIVTMWKDLEDKAPLNAGKAEQPKTISRQLKPFQLEGLAWMMAMEKRSGWKGGLLGDEMGLGKTIQAVSLIMSDFPAKKPSIVLVPPVALMQWVAEIESYTDGTLKTFIFHGTNPLAKKITAKELKKYDVILMSYNSLESMYRKQEKGFKRGDNMIKEKSLMHGIQFHRAILDEAHSIKVCSTGYGSPVPCDIDRPIDQNYHDGQGVLRPENGVQVVPVGHSPPKPHWRVVLSHQVPGHPPLRKLSMQAMPLFHPGMDHERRESLY